LTDYYAWLGEETAGYIAGSAAKDAETVQQYVSAFADAGCGELIFCPPPTTPPRSTSWPTRSATEPGALSGCGQGSVEGLRPKGHRLREANRDLPFLRKEPAWPDERDADEMAARVKPKMVSLWRLVELDRIGWLAGVQVEHVGLRVVSDAVELDVGDGHAHG
jgi:hypothetical protein